MRQADSISPTEGLESRHSARTEAPAIIEVNTPQRNRRRRLLSTSELATGRAGFIGSAFTRRLVKAGYDIAVMDVLHPQVHGEHAAVDLPPSVRLFTGRSPTPELPQQPRIKIKSIYLNLPLTGGESPRQQLTTSAVTMHRSDRNAKEILS